MPDPSNESAGSLGAAARGGVPRASTLAYRPAPGTIPDLPGVYRFRDPSGRVIYVGKAKSLRSRLNSYFADPWTLHPRTQQMVTTAASVDWITVRTEVEALQQEYTWIKEYDPRFNVKYRDDKSYPYLAVTLDEEYPRLSVMRGAKRKGVRYFGPYSHAWAIRETLDLLLRVFPARTCSGGVFKRAGQIGRPCLLGYIGKCSAPCVGRVSAAEHRRIVEEAEKRFASFVGPAGPAPEPARFSGGTRVETRDLEQVHIAMALEGVAVKHPDLYSMQVFTSALGGGMSSRLFQEVREIRGLCYTIHAFHMPYSDIGMFGLYAGTDETDAPELMRVVIDQIGNATETLNEAEVNRAKAQMKAGLLMALESSEARIGQLARQMLAYGRPIPLEEIVAKVDAVTVESARAAGRALVNRDRPAIAALGPGNGLESTAAIAESLVRRAA